ncbi:MAG: 3-phosphoshikimate 1-carboxyvinyltransferase [Candidatus Omnitrophota bacterium]
MNPVRNNNLMGRTKISNGMKPFLIKPITTLKGEIFLLGDKSIAHRSIIFSSLSKGITRIKNFPRNKDCLSTIKALRKLGVRINKKADTITVCGRGLKGLKRPRGPIFAGESGTTFRLMLGVLAGQDFQSRLLAGMALSSRPMLRVTRPLRLMGAKIEARREKRAGRLEDFPPVTISAGRLKGITYKLPVASAQVKSAILLAGLYASGKTVVIEPTSTRDHTERMLQQFGVSLGLNNKKIYLKNCKPLLSPKIMNIPGDISSAGFFIVLASILPDSKIVIKNVSLNPSRLGLIKVLQRMGADIRLTLNKNKTSKFEPSGSIKVKSSLLKGISVKKEEIPSLIDELPILMVAACCAAGVTVLEDVGELRVKETDRIRSMYVNLRKMGAEVNVARVKGGESILIQGKTALKGTKVRSYQDHRTAMSMVVAGLAASGTSSLDDVSCINKSFPEFLQVLGSLKA